MKFIAGLTIRAGRTQNARKADLVYGPGVGTEDGYGYSRSIHDTDRIDGRNYGRVGGATEGEVAETVTDPMVSSA